MTHAVIPSPLCSPWGVFNREGTGPVVTVVVGADAGAGAVWALAADAPM